MKKLNDDDLEQIMGGNDIARNDLLRMKTENGVLDNSSEVLTSMKEKQIKAKTDSCTCSDRVAIQKEINELINQIDDNALVTQNNFH